MTRRRALAICSVPGCPEYTEQGRCDDHRREAELRRGTARQRGYGRDHERRFRQPILARDPVCVLCRARPSKHADHWPLSRRELVQRGEDPNDPRHGRGLCAECHSSETARTPDQAGGWNRR